MKFKSDGHRKAVFANIFNRGGSRSKVSSRNVKNFEVKTIKQRRESNKRYGRFGYDPIHSKDIKTKEERAFCNMCKRRGLSLKKGRCKGCEKETKFFQKISKERFNTKEFRGDVSKLLDALINMEEFDNRHMRQELESENARKEYLDHITLRLEQSNEVLKYYKNLKKQLKTRDFSTFKTTLIKAIREIDQDRSQPSYLSKFFDVGYLLKNNPEYLEVTHFVREMDRVQPLTRIEWRPIY